MQPERTLVLLHSPLLGPGTWRFLAPVLRARGHDVIVVDYRSVWSGAGPYYSNIAKRIAAEVQSRQRQGEFVLVAHSGAGAILPSVICTVGQNVSHAMFLDALLPHPGRNWFSTVPKELAARLRGLVRREKIPPWGDWWPPGILEAMIPDAGIREAFLGELPALPLAYFEETAPSWGIDGCAECSYLRLSESYDREAGDAEKLRWKVWRASLGHLAMLTHPENVGAGIDGLVKSFG